MMKKYLIIVVIFFVAAAGHAQIYRVTYIKGNIYWNNKKLKLHDTLTNLNRFTTADKIAQLTIYNIKKGTLKVSFADFKPVKDSDTKHSEMYELLLKDYAIKSYLDASLSSSFL